MTELRIPNERFDVALSFSGNIRGFVEGVSKELKKLRLKVFYDNEHKHEFESGNVHEYFWNVYLSSTSRFCVIFLTNDYLLKKNPRLESEAIRERSMNSIFTNNFLIIVSIGGTGGPVLFSKEETIIVNKEKPNDVAKMIFAEIKRRESLPFSAYGTNLARMLVERIRNVLNDLNLICEDGSITIGQGNHSYSMIICPESEIDYPCLEIYEKKGCRSINSNDIPNYLLFLEDSLNVLFKICVIRPMNTFSNKNNLTFDEVVTILSNDLKKGAKQCF